MIQVTPRKEPAVGAVPTATVPVAGDTARSDASPAPVSGKPRRRTNQRFLPHLATRIFNVPLLIHPPKAEAILAVLGPRIGLAPVLAFDDEPMGPPDDDQEPDYCLDEDGIATIPIYGTLVKRGSGMNAMSGLTSYEALTEQIEDAITDPKVKGILFDVDSPGGEVNGLSTLADFIYSQRGQKPMIAVSNDDCYSAAYWLASCADQVFATVDGGCGSIGCYMLHADVSEMNKARGVKYTYVYAGDHKVDGNPNEPLSSAAEATMQTEVNRVRDAFVAAVARNRSVTADAVFKTQAQVYFAQAAIPLLADRIGNLQDGHAALLARIGPQMPAGPGDGSSAEGGIGDLTVVASTMLAGLAKYAGAIPPHKTATSDGSWDGPANEARLKLDQTSAYYRKAYAWQDPKGDGTKKNAFKFIHHEVSSAGEIGAANVKACQSGIGVLNGARGGTTIPAADRKGVYSHLAKHIRDSGGEPPDLKSEVEYPAFNSPPTDAQMFAVLTSMEPERVRLSFVASKASGVFTEVVSRVQRFPTAKASVSESGHKITMLVVPYDGSLSANLGGFREAYQPGCFAKGLGNDPRAVFNHDSSCILGRQSAGTARFWEDKEGVHVECDAPDTNWADDLLVSMRRGDITQASSAFWIVKSRPEMRNGERVRVVEEAIMCEAGPQAFPAYETTEAIVQQPAGEIAAAVTESPVPVLVLEHEHDEARLRLASVR